MDFEKVVENSQDIIAQLIDSKSEAIKIAFMRADEGKLSIGLTLKLTRLGPEKVDVEGNISFIPARIKDSLHIVVSTQKDMFEEEEK